MSSQGAAQILFYGGVLLVLACPLGAAERAFYWLVVLTSGMMVFPARARR
jgi:hypothetical protein